MHSNLAAGGVGGLGIGAVVGGHNSGAHSNNNNNGLLSNGNSSVPLYRRQALAGNGIGGGNSYNNMPGLNSGTNLIEALFQANNSLVDHGIKSSEHMQGVLFNNFNALKGGHDVDLFQANVPHSEASNHHQQSGSSSATTYAAVLSGGGGPAGPSGPGQAQQAGGVIGGAGTGGKSAQSVGGGGDLLEKDPFAAIRELGQATTGFYNYFQ